MATMGRIREAGDIWTPMALTTVPPRRMDDSDAGIEDTIRNVQYGKSAVTPFHITLILNDVGEDWKHLAGLLKLSFADIKNIGADNEKCCEKVWKVLETWCQREGDKATTGGLIGALEQMKRKDAAQKLLGSEKLEVGFKRARIQSGRVQSGFKRLREYVQNELQTIKKELKKILLEMQIAGSGEDEQQNVETRVQQFETTIKRLEMYLSDLSTEKSVKEGLVQDTTCVGNTCGQIDADLRDLLENLKMIHEDWREFAGVSSKLENTGKQMCRLCVNFEKNLDDIKAELGCMRTCNEEKWKDTRDKIVKEIGKLEKRNKTKLDEIEQLKNRIEKIKTGKKKILEEKAEVVEESKKMMEQIEKLEAEKEQLKLKLKDQIDPEKLDRVKSENHKLSTKVKELTKVADDSRKECQKLHERLRNLDFRSRVFLSTDAEFSRNCHAVICFLKRNASSKLLSSRSSDGPGRASDIFDHQKGTISGTKEKKDSWWSIDLGSSFRLVITHYSLRQGQKDGESALTQWQLQGSNDDENWKELETIHEKNGTQFKGPPPFYTGTWSVGGEVGAFRFFRIFQTGRNTSHKYGIYLSGIELFGMLLYI